MTNLICNAILIRLIILVSLILVPINVFAQQKKSSIQQYVVIDDAADVYEGKTIISRLKKDSTVWTFRENQGWLLVKIPGSKKRGWTQGKHLKPRQLDPQIANQWKKKSDTTATQVRTLSRQKKFTEALKVAKRSVEEHRQLYGDEHPMTLRELLAVGWLTAMTGRKSEGQKQMEAAIATEEALLSAGNPALMVSYELAARFALDFDESMAMKNYDRLLGLYNTVFKSDPAGNIKKHRSVVSTLVRSKKNTLAQRYAAETWKLVQSNQLENTETAFLVMADLGAIALGLNQLDQAENWYRRVLQLPADQVSGQGRGLAHLMLGRVLIHKNKRQDAASEWDKALVLYDKHFGADHVSTAKLLHDHGWNYFLLGDYAQGRTLLERALVIRSAQLPKDDINTAFTHTQLGYLCSQSGDHATALAHFRKGVEIAEAGGRKDSVLVAPYYSALGFGLGAVGDKTAREYFERSVKIYRNHSKEDSQASADAFRRLGEHLLAEGEPAQALPHLQRALVHFERKKNPLFEAITLSTIARVHVAQKQFDEALDLCKKALNKRIPIQGLEHQQVSQLRLLLARIHQKRGDLSEAVSLAESITRITRQNLGAHSLTVQAESELAWFLYAADQMTEAFASMDSARRLSRRHIRQQLPFLSAAHQLSYLSRTDRVSLHRGLAMAWNQKEKGEVAGQSAEWLINGKATSHEALALQHRLHRIASKSGKLETLQNAITGIQATSSITSDTAKLTNVSEVKDRISRLKSDLKLKQSDTSIGPEWVEHRALRQALKTDTVFVDFIRLQIPGDLIAGKAKTKENRYMAWITSAGDKTVEIVDIGPAGAIDAQIDVAMKEMLRTVSLIASEGEKEATQACDTVLGQLGVKLWAPLPATVKQAENVIISPDASLWLVPWSALPDKGEPLVTAHQIRLVVSGRDLIESRKTSKANPPLIVADPDFEASVTSPTNLNRTNATSMLTRGPSPFRKFSPVTRLKYAAAEAASIAPAIQQLCGQLPIVLTGKQATERAVTTASSPQILVLTTHGVFLPTDNAVSDSDLEIVSSSRSGIRNPLLRTGLLFAGFNRADPVSDGVLTGVEILQTDLENTDLVVMSACDTALGDINNGEGVAGLRQSFQLAGVSSVVASLWKIEDEQTALLMKDFFKNLAEGMDKAEALRQAQLTRIKTRRERSGAAHPFFWAAFTLTGQE